jgi:hypothetical protein
MAALFWAGKLHRATMTDRLKLSFIGFWPAQQAAIFFERVKSIRKIIDFGVFCYRTPIAISIL